MTFDLVLRGGTVASHRGIGAADIGVKDGRIAAVGDIGKDQAGQVIDATGLHILPGVIDSQVHFREPGMEEAEDLESGTRGAVLGGVTGVFEMPNTRPNTSDPDALADKVRRATGRAWCDFAFYMGGTAQNATKLAEYERVPGCCGVKVFMGASTGDLLVAEDEPLATILQHGSRRVAVHCEDNPRMEERKHLRGNHPRNHPVWRDEQSALLATQRLLRLAREARRRVHVLHVTTAEEMDFLALNKDIATVEVLPQHLTLVAPEAYERLGTRAQMNPPIRAERHRAALWRALHAGVVDVLGSDHAPHSKANKAKTYPESPSGMPGVQTILPLMLDHVAAGRLSLLQVVDLLCHGPARVWGIVGKGRIAVGGEADFSVVDLKARRTISDAMMATKCGWTPYDGMTVTGWPMMTIIRGETVMRDGELRRPQGRPFRFFEGGATFT